MDINKGIQSFTMTTEQVSIKNFRSNSTQCNIFKMFRLIFKIQMYETLKNGKTNINHVLQNLQKKKAS
jgi:hypothetical protein